MVKYDESVLCRTSLSAPNEVEQGKTPRIVEGFPPASDDDDNDEVEQGLGRDNLLNFLLPVVPASIEKTKIVHVDARKCFSQSF